MAQKARSGAGGSLSVLSHAADGNVRRTASPARHPPVPAGTRSIEVAATLRDEILRGQYRPGERLPSERELAIRFEVNRGAVREAIKKLEQLGIASVHPGGVRVVPIEDATLEVLGHLLDLESLPDAGLIDQLFEVMGSLLALSARTAVEKASPAQLKEAQALVQRIAASPTGETRHAAWRELGDLFNRINQNLVLRLIANGLKTQFMGRLDRVGIDTEPSDATRHALAELDRAIRKRNGSAVAAAVDSHFQLIRQRILDALAAARAPESLNGGA